MSFELDDLGERVGERPAAPAAPPAVPSEAASSAGQGRCTVRRMWITNIILMVLLAVAIIVIAVGLVYYFNLETNAAAPISLPSIGSYVFLTTQTSAKIKGITFDIVNTIDGNIKAPAIHVRTGSILTVSLTNGLAVGDIGLSIHWHGLNMKGAQVFDGVVGLTQCPMTLNNSFVYRWLVNEEPGTYWYHTHGRVMFPGNQIDLIRGPLIVHEANASIPVPALQDPYQIGNERILFYIMFNDTPSDPIGVLNGEAFPIIDAENGEYRFRIINGGGETAYFFSIDDYNLTVVATDGYSVEPYETEKIQIGIAERYDVRINFNIEDSTKDVCIRAVIPGKDKGIFGNLRIRKNRSVPLDKTSKVFDDICPSKKPKVSKVLNCYEPTSKYDQCHSVTELNSKKKRNLLPSFNYHTAKIIMIREPFQFKISLDEAEFKENAIPCRAAIMKSSKDSFPKNARILSLPTDASVTIVLLTNFSKEPHPMHSHGHHFEVLEIKAPDEVKEDCPFLDVNTAFSKPIKELMKRPEQGVLKDTVLLPPCGAVAVRLNSDNPGVWIFHCHIMSHLHNGFAFALNEHDYIFSQTDFPSDYPSCHSCDHIKPKD